MKQKSLALLIRYPLAAVFASSISYGLFYFMQSVALHDEFDAASLKISPLKPIEFTRIKRKETVEAKERKAPTQPEIQSAPSKALSSYQTTQLDVAVSTGIALPPMDLPSFGTAKIPTGVLNISMGNVVVDEEAMPIFRIPPIYPQRAAKRGLEGWVEVEFTITKAGTVKNARVVQSSPEGVFDQSALRAISRWKFKPKIVDQHAIERHHVRQRIDFQLEGKR